MTYFLRGTTFSAAVFCLIYLLLSIAVPVVWSIIRSRRQSWSALLLFALRMLPLSAASLFVAALVVPSFVFLEPYRTGESVGVLGFLLALGGLVILVSGVVSSLIAWRRTACFVTAHSTGDELRVKGLDTPGRGIKASMPMVLVAGIHRPKLLISEGATGLLEPGELDVAIQHELAHVVAHDNLKKLMIHSVKFPLMQQLERDWLEATEYAADDAAATSESAAVDLASALLKPVIQLPQRCPSLR